MGLPAGVQFSQIGPNPARSAQASLRCSKNDDGCGHGEGDHRQSIAYASRVIKPVHATELKAAPEHRQTLRQAGRDSIKVDHLLDETGRLRVSAALAVSESLNAVYELQNQLQAIWQKAGDQS